MMVTKKTSRNVIDYDPLAWLNEEPDESASDNDANVPVTGKVKKKATKKTAAKKQAAGKQSNRKKKAPDPVAETEVSDENTLPDNEESSLEKPAYGFFSEEYSASEKPDDEPAAFGFFDEADQSGTSEVSDDSKNGDPVAEEKRQSGEYSEEGSAYGFFDEVDALTTQAARLDSDGNIINLGAELTIRSVGACKELIDQSLSNGFDVRIAASELQKIDSAGLQLLYSLKISLEKTAQNIHWESASSMINEAAILIGMPKLCEGGDSDPGFGFFEDEQTPASSPSEMADEGYGFF